MEDCFNDAPCRSDGDAWLFDKAVSDLHIRSTVGCVRLAVFRIDVTVQFMLVHSFKQTDFA